MKTFGPLVAALALALAACAGPSTAPSGGAEVIGPIILGATDASATVTVGRTVVFDVEDPADWEVTADPEGLVEISLGGTTGDAVFNPGVTALAAGEVTVTLRRGSTGETRTYTLVIAGP
jgi:hypothetical protein